MTVTETISPAGSGPAAAGKHRAVATALPPARGQSFVRLVTTELRKSVDTRSGRVLILAILALALAALTWQLTHPGSGPAKFDAFLGAASTGVQLILPVIGVMAMTSEWSQRTALSTFTLSPRRVRVQLAKFVSAVLLSIVVLTATNLLALGATAIGGAIAGHGTSYAGLGGALARAYLTTALNVVMGAAFGAVIAQTAVAILVFFIAPNCLGAGRAGLVQGQRRLAGCLRRLRTNRRTPTARDGARDADRGRRLDRAADDRRTVGKLTSRGQIAAKTRRQDAGGPVGSRGSTRHPGLSSDLFRGPVRGPCVCRRPAPGNLGARLLTTDPWAPCCVPG